MKIHDETMESFEIISNITIHYLIQSLIHLERENY